MEESALLPTLLAVARDVSEIKGKLELDIIRLSEHTENEAQTWDAVRRDISSLILEIGDTRKSSDARIDKLEVEQAEWRANYRAGGWVIGAIGAIVLAVLGAALQVSHTFSSVVDKIG